MATKNGGPAFPIEHYFDSESFREHRDHVRSETGMGWSEMKAYFHGAPGMSLRDWFAGQAVANIYRDHNIAGPLDAAMAAYALADAMLAAREEQS